MTSSGQHQAPGTPSSRHQHDFQQYTFSLVNSPFGKPASSSSSSRPEPVAQTEDDSSRNTTSSLPYINAQLVSHGFSRRPLDLTDLRTRDQEQTVKCLFSMLQQRVEDLGALESLSTSYRTLTYDHERLLKMHKSLQNSVGVAETKEQAAKAQATAAEKALKLEQAAHKASREELQKAKTALAFVRNQAQLDIKKREIETTRTLERWQKLSTDQAKLMGSRSGLTCVNLPTTNFSSSFAANNRSGSPKTPTSLHASALQELEDARSRLVEENDAFRRTLTRLASNLQSAVQSLSTPDDEPSPSSQCQITRPSDLFESTLRVSSLQQSSSRERQLSSSSATASTSSHPQNARQNISTLLSQLLDKLQVLQRDALHGEVAMKRAVEEAVGEKVEEIEAKEGDLRILEGRCKELEEELKEALEGAVGGGGKEESEGKGDLLEGILAEVQASSLADLQATLETQRQELHEERRKFTEAAVRLGKERAEIEAERLALTETRRTRTLSNLLADLPPTPPQPHASSSSSHQQHLSSPARSSWPPRSSHHKSPHFARTVVLASAMKKTRQPPVSTRHQEGHSTPSKGKGRSRRNSLEEEEGNEDGGGVIEEGKSWEGVVAEMDDEEFSRTPRRKLLGGRGMGATPKSGRKVRFPGFVSPAGVGSKGKGKEREREREGRERRDDAGSGAAAAARRRRSRRETDRDELERWRLGGGD